MGSGSSPRSYLLIRSFQDIPEERHQIPACYVCFCCCYLFLFCFVLFFLLGIPALNLCYGLNECVSPEFIY